MDYDSSSKMHDRSSDYCPPQPSLDLLSDVLRDLRLARASYGRTELTRPFGVEIPYEEGVRFHFVAEGGCWLLTSVHQPLWLDAGDVVLLPHGTAHVIADEPTSRRRPLAALAAREVSERVYRLQGGGGGERCLVVCCTVEFEEAASHPLVDLMPDVILVRRSEATDAALPTMLDLMAAEVAEQRIGALTMMTRLADMIMTRIVRAWVETQTKMLTGWLAAARDPQIAPVLAAIHRRPGDPWRVDSLAESAGMSRSLFSERFTELVGMPPGRYLVSWRMHLASLLLRHERLTVSQVAARLGYESDAAFSRAFKRHIGVPPSVARRDEIIQ